MKKIQLLPLLLSGVFLVACETGIPILEQAGESRTPNSTNSNERVQSAGSDSSLRTIVLHGEEVTEQYVGQFTYWVCREFLEEKGDVLVELGRIEIPDEESPIGFVLYDGTNRGEATLYSRNGLERRWDWGEEEDSFSYAFTIEPDGTARYYDFTDSVDGRVESSQLYSCEKQ